MKKVLPILILLAIVVFLIIKVNQRSRIAETMVTATHEPPPAGINIGHWLSDELQFGEDRLRCDQPTAYELLSGRFGVAEADRLLDVYRSGFLREVDFVTMRSLGITSLRVPVSASLLYDKSGGTSRMAGAVNHIDWLLRQAETNGLSVVLNISVRPGQWAQQPSVNGRRFTAVWSDRDVEEAAKAWSVLATRFRGSKALIAYDLSPGPCQVEQNWTEALLAWSRAIEAVDTNRVIYAPWPKTAIKQLAAEPGFMRKKIGFSADFLPSGASPAASGEVRMVIEEDVPRMEKFWRAMDVASMASAYNPVIVNPEEPEWVGVYRGVFNQVGWDSYLWSFKSLRDPKVELAQHALLAADFSALTLSGLEEAPTEEIEHAFQSIATLGCSTNPAMLAVSEAKILHAKKPETINDASADDAGQTLPEGWKLAALGPVEQAVHADKNVMKISSSGLGPKNTTPELTFVYQPISGPIDLSVAMQESHLVSSSAGAGLMVRASLDEDAPYILVYETASDGVHADVVNPADQPSMQRKIKSSEGAKFLRVIVDGIVLKASCSTDGLSWPVAENFTAPWLTNACLAGCAVFSGHEYRTARATFNGLQLSHP